MAAKRDFNLGTTDSVLGEMYGFNEGDEAAEPEPPRRRRASAETDSAPDPHPSKGRPYTDMGTVETGKEESRKAPASGTRPDPEGMRRWSLYTTAEAAERFSAAVGEITAALGGDIPKHVAISALITYAADGADAVRSQLAAERAAALKAQIQQLGQLG